VVFFGTEVRWSGREVQEIVHLPDSPSVGEGYYTGPSAKEANLDGTEGKAEDGDTYEGGGTTAREAVVEDRRDSSHNYGLERKVRTA